MDMPISPDRAIALRGILFALAGSAVLSVNDVSVKFLAGSYALHQVILTRSVIGIVVVILLVMLSGQGVGSLRTARWSEHLLRVGFVMISNVTYFLGLAALPLADAVAIAFVSPLIVTALSVLVLRERVGPWRWGAVAVGMIGVVVMLRPGVAAFRPAALLVLISALCYASTHMMTRRMKATESAFALNFYVQLGFIVVSGLMGLSVGDGRFGGSANPSLAFLLHEWVWPPAVDWPVFLATGLSVAFGGLMIAQAYRLCEAALVAPFEYAAMPLAIMWGVLVFGTWPDAVAWWGIALICGAGLFTLWRETRKKRGKPDAAGSSDL